MGAHTLLDPYYGLTSPMQRRPSRLNFTGLDLRSPQASGLLAAFPMWEPPGVVCQNLTGLAVPPGKPVNILQGYDTYFGDVYYADGDGTGSSPVRGYVIPYSPILDIGLTPRNFSVSCWIRTLPGAGTPATDFYVFAFDTAVAPFPGYDLSLDSSNQVSFNTSNASHANTTARTVLAPFDGQWHHYLFVHLAGTALGVDAQQVNYIDGQFDSAYNACATIGSVSNGNSFFFGTDDDGATGQFGGYFFDLRIYDGAKTLADAQQMYHPDTRWDLFYP